MSKGGQVRIAETGTPASRVVFINSGDATAIFNDNTSNFMFVFDEPISCAKSSFNFNVFNRC